MPADAPAPAGAGRELAGATVAVTRAADQAGPLVERLRSLGAEVVEIPVIEIAAPADGEVALRHAVAQLDDYDWIVLTSPNAARRFLDAASGRDLPLVAAVGPGTAQVVRDAGATVALVPQRAIGEGLAEAFPHGPGRVLLPRAAVARDVVPDGLRAKGWDVDVVEAYRTVPRTPGTEELVGLGRADVVCFTSSSTVRALHGAIARSPRFALPAIVVSMGAATSATAEELGIAVTRTADPSTFDGLLESLATAWRERRYPSRP